MLISIVTWLRYVLHCIDSSTVIRLVAIIAKPLVPSGLFKPRPSVSILAITISALLLNCTSQSQRNMIDLHRGLYPVACQVHCGVRPYIQYIHPSVSLLFGPYFHPFGTSVHTYYQVHTGTLSLKCNQGGMFSSPCVEFTIERNTVRGSKSGMLCRIYVACTRDNSPYRKLRICNQVVR
jgi:hypothetical protein